MVLVGGEFFWKITIAIVLLMNGKIKPPSDKINKVNAQEIDDDDGGGDRHRPARDQSKVPSNNHRTLLEATIPPMLQPVTVSADAPPILGGISKEREAGQVNEINNRSQAGARISVVRSRVEHPGMENDNPDSAPISALRVATSEVSSRVEISAGNRRMELVDHNLTATCAVNQGANSLARTRPVSRHLVTNADNRHPGIRPVNGMAWSEARMGGIRHRGSSRTERFVAPGETRKLLIASTPPGSPTNGLRDRDQGRAKATTTGGYGSRRPTPRPK